MVSRLHSTEDFPKGSKRTCPEIIAGCFVCLSRFTRDNEAHVPEAGKPNPKCCRLPRRAALLFRVSVNPEGLLSISFSRLVARKSWPSRRCCKVGWIRQALSRSWCQACSGRRSRDASRAWTWWTSPDSHHDANVFAGRPAMGVQSSKLNGWPFGPPETGFQVDQQLPDPLGREWWHKTAVFLRYWISHFSSAFSCPGLWE